MLSSCGPGARNLVLSGLATIAFVAGCAGATQDTRRRLDDLEQQLLLAQNRNDRLEERVAALEAALDSEQRGQSQATDDEQPVADEHAPQLPVVRLRPSSEELVEGDPKPDALESEAADQSSGDRSDGLAPGAVQDTPPNSNARGSKKGVNKKAAPAHSKPREVIKVHGDGSQSRLSTPEPRAPWEVQSTCPV
jgi:hypothetical protein